MKRDFFILLVLLSALFVMELPAKKYELYGYSDFLFYNGERGNETTSFFSQNRTNILLASEFAKKWDFFLNLEFKGAFKLGNKSTSWSGEEEAKVEGSLELEEAWTGYTVSEKLKLKAGIFHAPFGSFNVIQDASPTYISVRPPLIYDDDFRSWNPVSIIPDKANLEISGRFPGKNLALEYHLYAGNGLGKGPENFSDGSDISFGGRLKLNYNENLGIGFSTYYDNARIESPFHQGVYNEKRRLFSVDADYTFWKFNVNAEYILNKNSNEDLGKFDRTFFYVNLNVEVVEKVRLYAEINNYKDKIPDTSVEARLGHGINKAIFGINFKPNWVTAIKAEVQRYYFTKHFRNSNTVFIASLSVVF